MRGQPSPPTAEKKRPNTVSAAIEEPLFAWMEDYRWDHRMTKTEVIVEAVSEWAAKRGYPPSGES